MQEQFSLLTEGCPLCGTAFVQDDAPAMVILHGGPGSGMEPLLGLPAFQELNRRFSTVYFDQRGSGNSRWKLVQGLPLERLTDDVEAVVQWTRKRMPGRPVYLWGGSFGGLLGLLYLERYPDSVDRAVISSPAISPGNYPGGREYLRGALEAAASQMGKQALLKENETLEDLFEPAKMGELLGDLDTVSGSTDALLYICAMGRWFLKCDASSSLKKLRIPTLLLQGMEDPICAADALLSAYQAADNAVVSLRTFSPCGHAVFEDCQEAFIKEIADFLKE